MDRKVASEQFSPQIPKGASVNALPFDPEMGPGVVDIDRIEKVYK